MRNGLNNALALALKIPGAVAAMFYALCKAAQISLPDDKNLGDVRVWHGKIVAALLNTTFFNAPISTDTNNFTNSAGAIRAQNEHIMIKGIQVYSGLNAAVNATDWAPGLTASGTQNGSFDLLINGAKVLSGIDLTVFNGDGTETSQLGYYELAKPILVPAQQSVAMNMTFAVAPAATTNILVVLDSFGAFS